MATIKGLWKFNETLNTEYLGKGTVSFACNGNNYDTFHATTNMGMKETVWQLDYAVLANGSSHFTLVYNSATDPFVAGTLYWQDEAYRTVDFGTTEQTVSDEFYTWLTANATQQVEEDSDENSTTITFDLSSLGLPTGTYSIHVKLNGDGYRDSDASNIVEYTVGGSSASLINFTINGTSYQAEEGMTWAEWVESDYNTDDYTNNESVIYNSTVNYISGIKDEDEIQEGAEYTLELIRIATIGLCWEGGSSYVASISKPITSATLSTNFNAAINFEVLSAGECSLVIEDTSATPDISNDTLYGNNPKDAVIAGTEGLTIRDVTVSDNQIIIEMKCDTADMHRIYINDFYTPIPAASGRYSYALSIATLDYVVFDTANITLLKAGI